MRVEWTPTRIRLFRESGLCLSQEGFARAIGFAKRTVGNAERGTHPPGLSLRRALDQVLEQATEVQRNRFVAALASTPGHADAPVVQDGASAVELVCRTGAPDLGPVAAEQQDELVECLGVSYLDLPLAEFRERVLAWRRYVDNLDRLTSLTSRLGEVTWWAPWE
ncbi:MAG: helix-turn-helix domain-containing protein, partial [Pseudonocardiaceae bacterium]